MVEQDSRSTSLVRFETFEVDLRTEEVRKGGVRLKLTGQPFHVLAILLERAGDVVTREELQKRLWPDTFVDVERNLNTAVNKIREVLGDSAETPRFVETLPRRGYRFIAPVEPAPSRTNHDPLEKAIDERVKSTNLFKRLLPILVGAAALAVGLVVWLSLFKKAGTPRVVRFTPLTSDGQRKVGPLVSDGLRVYFNEWLPDGRLILAQVSVHGGEAVPLSSPLHVPFVQDISKDGTELLLASEEGPWGRSIWVQPVAGGSPHRVGTVLTSWGPWGAAIKYAAFTEDGTHILFSQGYDIYSVGRDGSDLRKILTVGHFTQGFRYSPDSKMLRFTQFDPYTEAVIMTGSADATGLHKLVDGCCGEWTLDGRYFIFGGQYNFRSDLWALRESGKFPWQRRSDAPIQLTAGPLDFQSPLPARNGNEIFAIGTAYRSEVARYDAKSGEFVPYLSGISAEELAFSADGEWVAYTSFPEGVLWRSRLDGSEKIQLTFPPQKVAALHWSPDGLQIAFTGIVPGGAWNIHVIPSTGGSPERLLPSDQGQLDVGWSPDGKSLVFGTAFDPEGSIYIIDLNSRHVSTLPDSRGMFSPHWSPDGRYISGTVIKSANLMLFDTATQKWTKPCDCAVSYPMWSHDGKYLYFQPARQPGKGYRIARLRVSDHKIETAADISSVVRWTALTVGQWFGLTPDDSILIPRNIGTQEIYALEMQSP
jgi:DNA-binding winged helix-turn-helix (wHTH) protein/Tol biopolymer transport system component